MGMYRMELCSVYIEIIYHRGHQVVVSGTMYALMHQVMSKEISMASNYGSRFTV